MVFMWHQLVIVFWDNLCKLIPSVILLEFSDLQVKRQDNTVYDGNIYGVCYTN